MVEQADKQELCRKPFVDTVRCGRDVFSGCVKESAPGLLLEKQKSLFLVMALLPPSGHIDYPHVLHPDDVPTFTIAAGVQLKELMGRSAAKDAKTDRASVALFQLAPGSASAWSHNKIGEESFFILKGQGEVWTGSHAQPVRPGSFILIPPGIVRSIRATKGEVLEFYAITTPAWSMEDDVQVGPPPGAPA
jgi:mannose-6-phosphate isomerase-like protein (cupin superfamily)